MQLFSAYGSFSQSLKGMLGPFFLLLICNKLLPKHRSTTIKKNNKKKVGYLILLTGKGPVPHEDHY